MFYHAFDGYMENAFPFDELRPQSCEGEDTLGGYALTLVWEIHFLLCFFFFGFICSNSTFCGKILYHVGVMSSQIDSLDTLALLGDREQFASSVEWIGKNLRFDIVSNCFIVPCIIFGTRCHLKYPDSSLGQIFFIKQIRKLRPGISIIFCDISLYVWILCGSYLMYAYH